MGRNRARGLILLLAAVLLFPGIARSGTLRATVRSDGGEPIEHAVVHALPAEDAAARAATPTAATIDQIDKEYVPYVSAVQVGTRVAFPNLDKIRHHVYSFSPAKVFEIPLYKGTPAEPVLFDKPGPVTLGCNIHDWMKAYVYVVETPYYAITGADGEATLPDLPPGDYAVRVWHPRLKGEPDATGQNLSVGDDASLSFTIEQKRDWQPRRAPTAGGADYR